MNPPADELDPSRLESASFEMTRRGFDQTAVREELQRAAAEIRRLRLERDELRGRMAEFEGVSTDQLEAHRVAEALGVEATHVLEAAHLAARERAERAEREADAVRDAALAEAETMRAEAEAARGQLVEEAQREAETVIEDGRERGRDMVGEAQTVRERMLRDLARKRQTGRAQVEQLRAGRDRLLESLTIAQQSLDTAIVDLVDSVPEARSAAERAGLRVTSEPIPTTDELEGEIEAARLVGHPLVDDVVDPGPVDDVFVTGEMDALAHLDALDGDDDVPGGVGTAADEAADETVKPHELIELVGSVDTPDVDTPDVDTPDVDTPDVDTPEVDVADEPVDDGSSEGVELYDVEAESETGDGEDGVDDGASVDDAVAEPDADDVFAKLRSAHVADDAESESEPEPEAESESEPELEPESESEPESEPESVGGLDAARADARVRAADAVAKAMKKVLVEEQGTLLDGIRRSGAAALGLVIDDAQAHRASYEAAASAALKTLAADLGGSKRLRLTPAYGQIEAIALAPVRQRLSDVAERVDDADELSDTVRALYRESRSRRIDEAAAAAAVAVDGLVAVATAGGSVEWHVDPGGPCGPDCADNALAGAIEAGEEFPTGDHHPPAHPACTCWLEPAVTD